MVRIPTWSLCRIDMRRRYEFGVFVRCQSHHPAAVMDDSVMVVAKRHAVVAVGAAAVDPVPDVMDVGPAFRSIAAGERAALVAQQHGLSCCAGE